MQRQFYADHNLQSLREEAEKSFQASGLPETIDALIRIITKASKQSLLVESDGISAESKRIAFDLR